MPSIVALSIRETSNMKRLPHICSVMLCLSILIAGCAGGPQSQGWITLFDGRNLDGWNRTGEANWSLGDGAVMADKGGKTPSYLVSKESYGDFELRLEFWATADAGATPATIARRAADGLPRTNPCIRFRYSLPPSSSKL